MARVGIIYGSVTGNTRDVAQKLQQEFGSELAELVDVSTVESTALCNYDYLVFAVSTWGAGDLQDDWETFYPDLDDVDLTGKKVAILGIGDQQNYPDTFADAVAILADKAVERGATLVGLTEPEGYTYTASRAERDGRLLGLVVDEDSQRHMTDARIRGWVEDLRKEFS